MTGDAAAARADAYDPPAETPGLYPVHETYAARQAIFDRQMRTVGYELLFRSGDGHAEPAHDDANSARTIVAALADIGLEALVGDTRAFLNTGRSLILDGQIRICPPDRTVVQVRTALADDPEALTALQALVAEGYELALDDFCFTQEATPLVQIATCVKLDTRRYSDEKLAEQLKQLAPFHDLQALAYGVETQERYHRCYKLGFDLFQGYFFAHPELREGRVIGADKVTRMQLIASLQDENVDPERLEKLVARDLGLSHRVLLFVNSAYIGMPREIHSIRQAIMLLGFRQLRHFATLVSLADSSDRPRELLVSALVRARMCELLAPQVGVNADSAFTVGLFSAADALLGVTMPELVEKLPFAEDTKVALTGHEGPLGRLLQVALTYERGALVLAQPGISIPRCREAYVDAVSWSARVGSLSAGA